MNPDNPIVLYPTAGDSPKMFYPLYKTPMTKDGAPVLATRIKRRPRPMDLQNLPSKWHAKPQISRRRNLRTLNTLY